jgi:hypothetical protein
MRRKFRDVRSREGNTGDVKVFERRVSEETMEAFEVPKVSISAV